MDSHCAKIVAAAFGAFAFEVVQWYDLRAKLSAKKYQKLIRSKGYWIITVLMMIVGSGGAAILFLDRLAAPEMMVAGAAFPTLFKKLVSAFKPTGVRLGEAEKPSILDYFT